MVNINGKIYSGNVTIVNGQVISGDLCEDTSIKKFDETKKQSANGIKRINIDSSINVNVSACKTNDVTAHLHGSVIMGRDIDFSMTKIDDEVYISTKEEGISISCNNMTVFGGCSVVMSNFSSSNRLTLDVQIPIKAFEKISIESKNANIDIKSSVYANAIKVDNENGNVDVSAVFQTLNIDSKNGNIDVDSEAKCDITLNVTNKNGNANVSIGNIGNSKVSVDVKNGSCKNKPRLNGRYTASGYITSKNGNAKFC